MTRPEREKRYFPRLAKRLAKLRAGTGQSLQVFATLAKISIPRLRDAECFGLATPDTLERIAVSVGVSVVELTGARRGGD